jgi:ribosomal protein S18 acetylase RimI-like enzyme
MSYNIIFDKSRKQDVIFEKIFKYGILNKYHVDRVDYNTYWEIYNTEFAEHHNGELTFIHEGILSNKEKELYLEYNHPQISNFLVVKDNNKIIALFRSEQKEENLYYMRHAIVDKNYRRQGIYNDYLTKIIQYAKEMGFSQIVSCFVAANNVIHQAKVKKEFYVSSFEIHPEYGNIIWLTHFLNDDLKKAFYFRSGMVEFSKKLFQNSEGNANNLLNKILKSSH